MADETEAHEGPVILDEAYGAGDTFLILNVLPPDLAKTAFQTLQQEVDWKTMAHRGGEVPRLISVQGDVEADGSVPLYRHPADEPPTLVPYTPTAARIRDTVEKQLQSFGILSKSAASEVDKNKHTKEKPILNHALVQLYRNGTDYISEHADKTIDIVHDTPIISVSLGAQRTMTLRPKKGFAQSSVYADEEESHIYSASNTGKRPLQRIPLPHNSALVLGPHTNRGWLHAIRPDRRPAALMSPEAVAAGGARASLTFRAIGTFLSPADRTSDNGETTDAKKLQGNEADSATSEEAKWLIWGQGAVGKTRADARPVKRGGTEAEGLLAAFGAENRDPDFDWENSYGNGFDVVHFS